MRSGVGIVWDVGTVWAEGADGREMRVVGNGCSGAAGR
ncbi:hypothetical protein ACTODO_01945 [Schaalia dentiphila ATCC 17982]|jgi:hypothetical protein|uniref:Uncharacterized protein n=1 Tax=Schaalia dentiphila ATCC 17982 TaxID=411466 RepID=A7BE44_9ACTO|nr:hypothetical protein ACTODO_01945 [Schaalia odontolytica ATCC 17982]